MKVKGFSGSSGMDAPAVKQSSERERLLKQEDQPAGRTGSSKGMVPRSVKDFGKALLKAPAAFLDAMDKNDQKAVQEMIDRGNGALPTHDESIKQSLLNMKAGVTKGLAKLTGGPKLSGLAERAAQKSFDNKRKMALAHHKYADERLAHAQEKVQKAQQKVASAVGTPKQQQAEAALAKAQEKLEFIQADRSVAYANRERRDA